MPKGYGRSGMASKYKEQIMGHEKSEEQEEYAKQKDLKKEAQAKEDLQKIQNLKEIEPKTVQLSVRRRRNYGGNHFITFIEIVIVVILAILAGITLYCVYDPQFGIDKLTYIKEMQQRFVGCVGIRIGGF